MEDQSFQSQSNTTPINQPSQAAQIPPTPQMPASPQTPPFVPATPTPPVKPTGNKKALFIILFLLLLIIFAAVYFFFIRKPDTTSNTDTPKTNTNTNDTTNDTNVATENTIVCDVNNKKMTYTMNYVNSMKNGANTIIILMASYIDTVSGKPYIIQISLPNNTTMDYTLGPTDKYAGLHYDNGSGFSYQTKAAYGDTYHVNVTTFDDHHIVGTTSGETTKLSTSGWIPEEKISFKNCSFNSTKEIDSIDN